MVAHISGLPVEETAGSFGPIFIAIGGIAGLRLRERILNFRSRRHRIAFGARSRGAR